MVYGQLERYTLVITEKPDAASRIAAALDIEGKAEKVLENGVPYYLAKRKKRIVVVPALGHLYTIASKNNGYPVFDYQWVPLYVAKRGEAYIRKCLKVISTLAKHADEFIDACDYDIEGSIIGYTILKYACGEKEKTAQRMKYSTLTKDELERAFEERLPQLDFALVEAGLTRHEVDWLYGINLSRALTAAAKNYSGKYAMLSTGRVQGPTLNFLVSREKSIGCFVPTPYWSIKAEVEIDGVVFESPYVKRVIETKAEAEALINSCKDKVGIVTKVEKEDFIQKPPVPFDLGSLQFEAYHVFGYTPMRTAQVAQRLYLDALISYPRTSSQKLPAAIGYHAILKGLERSSVYSKLTQLLLAKPELKPVEGEKDDPAHPAIYPTGNMPERTLNIDEKNIWDLVVRRFMSAFGDAAIWQNGTVTLSINGNLFTLNGQQVLSKGWLHFYEPYVQAKGKLLPNVRERQEVSVRRVVLEAKFTNPPPRYNPSSLLRKMEEENIGTKATRAGIIQTLYNRKYICGESIIVTELGFEVVDILKKYCPTVISVELTRELEEKMENIQRKKETKENVLQHVIGLLCSVTEHIKENEQAMGASLSQALQKEILAAKSIGECPICRDGRLIVLRSKKTGKRFVGCTNHFVGSCKTAFPLPQKGLLKSTGKICATCGFPSVQVQCKGRRPWRLCLNPKCPTKENAK
ncbi:MAG: DNA topoisomerase I [Candidatus Bathyarchaeota archaeon]|nr:DNA topoisomerase I [Candidatus Bathyarchaeota archaeon]